MGFDIPIYTRLRADPRQTEAVLVTLAQSFPTLLPFSLAELTQAGLHHRAPVASDR